MNKKTKQQLQKYSILLTLTFLGFSLFGQSTRFTSPREKTRILFVLDASNSMIQYMDGSSRMEIAKKLMSKMVDSLGTLKNVEVALRVFGHQSPIVEKNCMDTRLEVPFKPGNIGKIKQTLKDIKPIGYTLIAQSILSASKDFPDANARNIIVLITDGVEECDGDPCAIAKALLKKGIVLQPFVVGIGDKEEIMKETYDCVGKYYNANNESEFENVFNVIISQALNSTSAQINLLTDDGRPLETDIPFTLYNANTGAIFKNYVHTMNGRAIPDTLYLDPLKEYNLVLHTVPPVYKNNISLIAGRHNTIAIDAGLGKIALKCQGVTNYPELKCIIRKKDSMETINAQPFNTEQKYLTGLYDIEILSVPRIYYKNIRVRQDNTTTIEIPQPGVLSYAVKANMVLSIFYLKNNKMVWVMDIPKNTRSKNIIMQPGNYIAIGRISSETRTIYTKNKNFKVTSGQVSKLTF